MLTCRVCGCSGADVHMYRYVGNPVLLAECDDLERCFARTAKDHAERRTLVEPPDYPCVGDGYECPQYDITTSSRCRKGRESCSRLSDYRKSRVGRNE